MSDLLRVAVVGCGVGREHLKAFDQLRDQYSVVALCDLDTERARALAGQYAVPDVLTDLEALCHRPDLDVIDLCTPSFLHYPQARQALLAGKHVICEKPLAGSLAQIDDLARIETTSGRRLMPIFQYRFGHGLQKLRYLQSLGLTGRAYVAAIETSWRRRADYYATPWRGKWATELGGTLVTHAIHAHDALCYVLGPVRSVFARLSTQVNPIEVEDCVSASLEMADGSYASLAVTTGSPDLISRMHYSFANLSAASNLRPYDCTGDPWTFTGDTPEISAQIDAALQLYVPQPESYLRQFGLFHEALRTGGALPVSISDARTAVELIAALYYSARNNRPVDLPLGPDHPYYNGWQPA